MERRGGGNTKLSVTGTAVQGVSGESGVETMGILWPGFTPGKLRLSQLRD